MIKEKLMDALKDAVEAYNGGDGASEAVAKAAEAADFNEKQAERLVEMFNTLATINKEKDKSDPTGTCDLASKEAVAKKLLGDCVQKSASVNAHVDRSAYSFYSNIPEKTNLTMEARESGLFGIVKAASSEEAVPDELDVSQRSLHRAIDGKIDLVKSAGESADDVVRMLNLMIEGECVKIAKLIERSSDDEVDMFKAACGNETAISEISKYSTKLASSDGGVFARREVFDASDVEDLLKMAENVGDMLASVPEYERKRDFYLSKAADCEEEMRRAVGIEKKAASVADFFNADAVRVKAASANGGSDGNAGQDASGDADLSVKLAEMIRRSGVDAEEVGRLAEDLEKSAGKLNTFVSIPSPMGIGEAITHESGIPQERQIILNNRRAIILADLMMNDPIIRDADPEQVVEIYKTMAMASPRVSLDKAQVRSVLRAGVNSNALSPNDAKVLSDVDKGMSIASIDKLTSRDSSIKDSNLV